jgi:hypothetical protein
MSDAATRLAVTVYLAEDLKHRRKVAVKVLRPKLAATLGPERFAREIAVAARLPGAPFTPLLTGLRWCTGSAPSLSDDNRHLACTQTTIASDVWLVSGFDVAGR